MHPCLLLAVDLFNWLPGWGAVVVVASVALGLWAAGRFLVHRFQCNINQAIRQIGEPLCDALVNIHSVDPAERPTEFSPAGVDVDDGSGEQNSGDLEFSDHVEWFWVEATIVPRDGHAAWDPRRLELVSSDFDPTKEFEVCDEAGALHTVDVWQNGWYELLGNRTVIGPQRLRMLFAIPPRLRDAKFASQFTCFGSLALPRQAMACS